MSKPTARSSDWTAQIYRQRRAALRRETAPYWIDVMRSGFGTFLFLAVVVGGYYYIRAVQAMPPSFPFAAVGAALLAPLLAVNPVRTLLREADLVFLLPAEERMGGYWRSAFRSAAWRQTAATLVAGFILWPLYAYGRGDGAEPLPLVLAMLAACKLACLAGAWQELRLLRDGHRKAAAVLRSLAAVAAVYLLYQSAVWLAAVFALAFMAAYAAALSRLPKLPVHWNRLLERERRQQTMLYSFFSMFTDVPAAKPAIRQRAALASFAERCAFAPEGAMLYLYAKTLIRSELFGIVVRLTLLGALLAFAIPADAFKAAACGIMLLGSAMQLTALERAHRHSFWLQLYPLDRGTGPAAAVRIARIVLLLQCAVLGGVLLIAAGSPLAAAAFWAGGGLFASTFARMRRRRQARTRDLFEL